MAQSGYDDDRCSPVWAAWAFAGATLTGAFLLFQIQPLISKFILPWFGGAPAVWTTCMLFFQIVLFAGYAYSHLLVARLTPRGQAIAQGVLLVAALAVLPIAPSDSWKPSGSAAPTGRILLLLTATVGLPYFVLSTTSPLIQSWFSRSYPGRVPYRLYSLSNVGSLAALLTYPFVFEPAFDLTTQARLWSWSFPVYAALTGLAAAAMWRSSREPRGRTLGARRAEGAHPEENPEANASGSPAAINTNASGMSTRGDLVFALKSDRAPTWLTRALWLLLPAGASVILLATTSHVCQNVAPAPFLWVMPLSLYLLSFIICFDHSRWYVRPIWAIPAIIGIAAVMGGDEMLNWLVERYEHQGMLTFTNELAMHFGTMFCICMVCHGELVRLKPEPRRLTEFYLCISAGGALGGVLVSLVAPRIFNSFLEWNLGMLAAYVLAAVVLFLSIPRSGWRRVLGLFAGGFAVGGFLVVLIWQFDWTPPKPGDSRLLDSRRNFYGVISVTEKDDNDPRMHRRRLNHGAIRHGQQFLLPEKRRQALTYYTPDSGVGRAMVELQKRKPKVRVAVVGLGIGTLAAYARPGDHFTFYEINPAVVEMAEKYFYYLQDARDRGAEIEIVLGDARLMLDAQSPQHFDLLALDAFSGDSVPAHLLTREAMDIYAKHVAAESILAIHVTNSYLYLFPVARALADYAHRDWRRVYVTEDSDKFRNRSDWVIVGCDASFLSEIPNIAPPPNFHDDFTVPVWTDQKNDQFRILIGRR